MPLLSGQCSEIRTCAFSEVNYHAAYEPQRSIRTLRWAYIKRFGDRAKPVLANCDEGESRDMLLEHDWGTMELDAVQLYDNVMDPNQKRNLAQVLKLATVREELDHELLRWMRETANPLLDGDVPMSIGALINDPSSRSPADDLLVAAEDGQLVPVLTTGRNA